MKLFPSAFLPRFALFAALLVLLSPVLPGRAEEGGAERIVFGASERGRELYCWRVGSADAPRSFLMVFAVHAFEDKFARDGLLLTETAEALLARCLREPALPGDTALYIVPCLNPDGLAEGTGNEGFGRCNALGLDINRDFPEGWVKRTQSGNRTGDAPLSTAEARALTDLVLKLRPDYACDVHGYVNKVKYGANKAMASVFAEKLGMKTEKWQSGGMLSVWLDTVTSGALLIELPSPLRNGNVNLLREGYADGMAEKLFSALEAFLASLP